MRVLMGDAPRSRGLQVHQMPHMPGAELIRSWREAVIKAGRCEGRNVACLLRHSHSASLADGLYGITVYGITKPTDRRMSWSP